MSSHKTESFLCALRNPAGELVHYKLAPGQLHHPDTAMREVFLNGNILVRDNLDVIRERAWPTAA